MGTIEFEARRQRCGVSLAALARLAGGVEYHRAHRAVLNGRSDSPEFIRLAAALESIERDIAAAVVRQGGLTSAAAS